MLDDVTVINMSFTVRVYWDIRPCIWEKLYRPLSSKYSRYIQYIPPLSLSLSLTHTHTHTRTHTHIHTHTHTLSLSLTFLLCKFQPDYRVSIRTRLRPHSCCPEKFKLHI